MTDLIEVKTADLAGEALGWAVGMAEGLALHLEPPQYGNGWRVFAIYRGEATERCERYNPWEAWALGGALVDQLQVALIPEAHEGPDGTEASERWRAEVYYKAGEHYGTDYRDTALIAACQAVVATEFGDTVQVPKELMP
ncbi:phage protein NinX family protein [Pseudomonas fulva]|uniref:phage protein NinX family protein n=1 Tax=Pseudomonas fulva TaxID=47880 RepID=UPI002DB66668|nr:phage protein NinX family protein [Pseudomonas fulva]MEC4022132.1 phage protein NinX family protein [Pseudomonas fulva]